jgi:DNA-directed RNA polymerase beta' subunit
MEDMKVQYDGTVRSASRMILQFAYGADNMDSTRVEKDGACAKAYVMSDTELRQRYKLSVNDDW